MLVAISVNGHYTKVHWEFNSLSLGKGRKNKNSNLVAHPGSNLTEQGLTERASNGTGGLCGIMTLRWIFLSF